jgi:uncharacterized damage-inducible protein DinB
MRELERISDQLRRSMEGEAWHGPALMEALDGVTAEKAAAKPINEAHSIWEIVLHVDADIKDVTNRLRGIGKRLTPSEDWPEVSEISEQAWQNCLEDLKKNCEVVTQEIPGADESKLDQEILPGSSTLYVTLHGMVQHNLYHAGQIVLLRKG